MGSGSEEAGLEVLGKSVVDGKRNDEGRDTGRDSGDGDAGNHANNGLSALGAEITGRDEEFESQEARSCQLTAISKP